LAALTPETTFKLFQSGALHIAYLHLCSLDNLHRLVDLHTKRLAVNENLNPTKNALAIA
jgi:GTP cyclohydrolase I